VAAIEPLGPASRKTYKLEIYEGLHELIQTLGLPPGERLVEHELSVRFGVSKTPVREALLLLERERLPRPVPPPRRTVPERERITIESVTAPVCV